MRLARLTLLSLAVTACADKSRLDSARFETARERAQAFCEVTLCPQHPEDVVFQVVAGEVRGVARLSAEAVGAWGQGCRPAQVEARPPWVSELLKGTGWVPASVPDKVRCGRQTRVIHVRERLVVVTAPRVE